MKNERKEKFLSPIMTKEDFVYSRIGMALTSAQRVEYIAGQVLVYLSEFDKELYGITTSEFLKKAAKSKNDKKTLGTIFKLLKFNPKLVIENELDEYLTQRNLLVHKIWTIYLQGDMDGKDAVDFCYDFGRFSNRIESFFKGFLYYLTLRHVSDRDHLDPLIKKMDNDFEYFISALHKKNLKNKD